jgi:hypothetical protein
MRHTIDKQTQAVAEALSALWIEGATVTLEEAAKSAIKASGAEHLGELVKAMQEISKCRTTLYDSSKPSYEAELAAKALSKLPLELRGES